MNAEPIKITIDQEQIREQVEKAIQKTLQEASWKLRQAADAFDPSFVEEQRKWQDRDHQAAYDRGFKAGVESTK